MSVLTATEQALFDVAKASLPEYLFTGTDDITAELAAFAKQFGAVFGELDLQVKDTFLALARTEALNQHAKDRGTRRQNNESNAAISYRLRFMREDAVTPAALRARVRQVMSDAGLPLAADYIELVELRRDRAYYGAGPGVQYQAIAQALISNGETFKIGTTTYEFRKTGSVTAGHVLVDISAATTAATVATAMYNAMLPQLGGLVRNPAGNSIVVIRRAVRCTESVANAGFTVTRKKSYFGRGYRMTTPARGGTAIIFILPYGTTADTATAIAEALRQIKAGGVQVIVERRTSP